MVGKSFELNWLYIAFVIVGVAAGLGFVSWAITEQAFGKRMEGIAAAGGFDWLVVISVYLFCAGCFIALLWKIYCDYKTEFTEEAVIRPALFRVRVIRWADVIDLKVFNEVGYHIHSYDERIVVSPYAYKNPNLVISEMMRLWSAAQQSRPEPNKGMNRTRN